MKQATPLTQLYQAVLAPLTTSPTAVLQVLLKSKNTHLFNPVFTILKMGDYLDSSVGIVARQRARKSRKRRSTPAPGQKFSHLQSAQTDTGAHPAPRSTGIRWSVPRVTRPRRENESPQSSADDKNEWSYPSNPIGVHGVVLNPLKTKMNLNYI